MFGHVKVRCGLVRRGTVRQSGHVVFRRGKAWQGAASNGKAVGVVLCMARRCMNWRGSFGVALYGSVMHGLARFGGAV